MSEERFNLSRRKALAALGTIGVASAGAGLGTSAYFSDQETFENNQLTAGTLDLGVGYSTHYSNWSDDEGNGVSVRMYDGAAGETGSAGDLNSGETGMPTNDAWLIAVDDPDTFLSNTQEGENVNNGCASTEGVVGALTQADGESAIVNIGDVKPGDFGEVTFDLELCTNPGYVWMNNPGGYTANENQTTEPEADDPDEGAGVELMDVVQAAVWLDSDGGASGDDGNNYQNGSEYPLLSGSLGSVLDALNSGNGVRVDGVSKEKLTTDSTVKPKDWTRVGVNRLSPGDETYDVDVELVDAPGTSPPQSQVAHITSGGTSTLDYATTAVSVDGQPTLSDINSLTYDYYGGASNEGSAPDEVFLLLEEADGTQTVVGQSFGDGSPSGQSWNTRDVASEFGSGGWFSFETNSDGVIEDSDSDSAHYDVFGSLTGNFDASATRVLGMAAARGSTSGAILDLYVANPELTTSSGTTDLGEFPTACFRGETEFSAAFAWWVPVDHGNEIQSDSVEFDLGFYTEQCRHNDGSGMNNEAVDDTQTDDSATTPTS